MGRECQISVLVKASSADSYQVRAQELNTANGAFEPALGQLLAGSPFTYELSGPGAVAIVPRKTAPEEPSEAHGRFHTEEITVTGRSLTGTHLRHPELESYAPIDVLAQPELEITGAQTIAELLKFLPAVAGNSTSTAVTNGGNGTATVTLRGLPASNTLVLINGRRIVSNGFGGEAADLNTIPLSSVDRIEILKDGASAVYGSDAIAGVVNIILRRDFDGLSVNSYYGQAEEGDQETESHYVTWGTTGDRGHVMLSLAHYRQGQLLSRDRELSETADNRLRGGTDLRSSASPGGFIDLGDDSIVTFDEDGYRPWTPEDLYNYREFTSALVPSERHSVYAEGNLDLSDNALFFVDAMAVRTRSENTLAPTPIFTRFENGDLTIAANNIYNPFGQDITDVRKRVLELGPRKQENLTDTWRLNSGLKGIWDSWQWELTLALHYTEASERLTNLVDPNALSLSLKGPDICAATIDCVPVNLLGPTGSITPEQLDYVRGSSLLDGASRMGSITYITNGVLGSNSAGEILAAAGVEVRREAIDFESTNAMGLSYIGGSSSGSAEGHRLIGETFAEISVPLLTDRLWLDGAVRYSDYSDFGSTTNPKLAMRWRPAPTVLVRASYATGFKAPTLIDMNQNGYQSQEYLFDPCTRSDASTLPGCRGQADQARIQYLTSFGGNTGLQPETSDNRSLGIVWTPAAIQGFSATLDVFDIRQNDVIDTNPQFLIDKNAYTGLFTNRVLRDESGDIIQILATRLNIGAREVRGVDLALRYEHDSQELGQFRWALNGSQMQQYRNQAAPGAEIEDFAGIFIDPASGGAGSLPEWKANTGVYWKKNRWEGGYTVHYVGKLDESFTLNESLVTRQIDSWFSHDMQLAYSLPKNGLRFALGIDNVFDRDPPFAATAFNDNFDSRSYDLSGRYWYTTLAYSL